MLPTLCLLPPRERLEQPTFGGRDVARVRFLGVQVVEELFGDIVFALFRQQLGLKLLLSEIFLAILTVVWDTMRFMNYFTMRLLRSAEPNLTHAAGTPASTHGQGFLAVRS